MATAFARYVGFAPLKTRASDDGTTPAEYDAGGFIGKLMNVNITPNHAKVELYGDDEIAERVDEVTSAAIAVGTTTLPWEIGSKMFGYTVKGEDGAKEIINKSDDKSAVGMFCYCYGDIVNGKKHVYVVCLPETEFELPADSVTTRGTSITLSTPTLNGVATPDPTGEWRHIYECKTFLEAKTKIKELLNITT